MTALLQLSDNQLVDVYKKANEGSLEEAFIQLLRDELRRRGFEEKVVFPVPTN